MISAEFRGGAELEELWVWSMPALMIASSLGCIWFRRRRRSGEIRRQLEERHLQQVVSVSIQHQRQEHQTHAAPPVPHSSSYIVPRGAYVGCKVEDDDQMIDWAEISVEDDTLLKESCTAETYFQMKLNWLEAQLRKLHHVDDRPIGVEVDRNDLFYDSFRAFTRLSGEQLRSPLELKFKKEDGRDDGGLTRHWFMLISREVTNPEYGLFSPLGKNRAYQINPISKHQPHHLEYFRFIGRVWAKAVFDGFLVESHFVSTIYKYLMGKDITPSDLGVVDNTYYASLQWILENDIEHAELDLTFVVDEEEFGEATQVDLKEGGSEVAVTNENKDEYVHLICMQRLVNSIKPQLDALKEGFYDIMPQDILSRFSEEVSPSEQLRDVPVLWQVSWCRSTQVLGRRNWN